MTEVWCFSFFSWEFFFVTYKSACGGIGGWCKRMFLIFFSCIHFGHMLMFSSLLENLECHLIQLPRYLLPHILLLVWKVWAIKTWLESLVSINLLAFTIIITQVRLYNSSSHWNMAFVHNVKVIIAVGLMANGIRFYFYF